MHGEETVKALWEASAHGKRMLDKFVTGKASITRKRDKGAALGGYARLPAPGSHLPGAGILQTAIDPIRIIEAITRKPAEGSGLYP